jgi:hypothetical protein
MIGSYSGKTQIYQLGQGKRCRDGGNLALARKLASKKYPGSRHFRNLLIGKGL